MCRKLLIAVFLLLLCAGSAMAFDFSVTVPGGQTLYFSYVDGGVAVVHPNTSTVPANAWNNYARPTGAIIIPSTVEHSDVEYNVVAIGDYAFFGCEGITTVTVGEGVGALNASVFRGCIGLTAVTLPSTIDTIGNFVFYNCSALQSVAIGRVTPPGCATNAFHSAPISDATLTVPYGSTAAYENVVPWNSFGTIVETVNNVTLTALPNYEERGQVDGGGVYVMGDGVVLTATPANGYFFACWNDGDTVNPRNVTATQGARYVAHFFAYRHDTIYLPVHDTTYLPVHDTTYLPVHDTTYLPVYDTVYDTVYVPVHDTIYVPVDDTTHIGVKDCAMQAGAAWTASANGRSLTVRCGVGETVRLFDLQGRCLMVHRTTTPATTMMLPAAGVYLVSVGAMPAKRIVIE